MTRDEKMRQVMMSNVAANRHAPVIEADLEEALELAGTGRYQVVHNLVMLATLFASILEMVGIAFILPAAACDLDIPDYLKGILTSLPNIGIILTAPFWGRAADSLGRKPVLLGSLIVSGVTAFIAAFMPSLITFALFKLASSLFLSCPSSLGYAYVSEMLPRKRRDFAVLVTNGLINLLTVLSPGLAWIILSYDWEYQFGAIDLRPWRLLTAVYAFPLLLAALCLIVADESPKFLMTKGKDKEALAIVRKIYCTNSGLHEDSFCVKSLKIPCDINDSEQRGSGCALAPKTQSESAFALLRPPHLKWFALTGFLMFGLFSFLNGLFLFAPDTINKVMNSNETSGTVCELMDMSDNSTSSTECLDSMSYHTFYIMVVTTIVYGVLVTAGSMSPLSKKTLLVSMFCVVGVGCLIAGLSTNRILAGVAMSSLQLTALGIGPLTAYVVQLFPTALRGTAVGAVLMFGRLGSVVGANAAGVSLSAACTLTFYGFAFLVFLCAGLSFLLPSADQTTKPQEADS
ncbi:organic cation/carnitine transporter 7-like isoform X1 [Spodoptera litura]|uniref:Organic cation/carnitine transporter 7-like isoform X1 n=2 Tax=Spodoptera litura TaxID=69820 RepID=A0A9J7E8C2_SPOLT|nr:organic cation/carnitine transporter 7-like isoform X1 [Spodoptera litura]